MKSLPEQKHNNRRKKRILGSALIALGCLCMLAGIFPSFLMIGNFFLGLFGLLFYPIDMLILLIGIALLMNLKYAFDRKFTFYSAFALIGIFCLLHIAFTSGLMLDKFVGFDDYGSYVSACFNLTNGVTVGGILMGSFVYFFRCLIGLGATYVLFAIVATLFVGLFIDYLITRNKMSGKKSKVNTLSDDLQVSKKNQIEEELRYIESLNDKLTDNEETFSSSFAQENKEGNQTRLQFDDQIGVNKEQKEDESVESSEFNYSHQVLFGDSQPKDEETSVQPSEVQEPRSAHEVLFGDAPKIPNIFDRDPSERNEWRKEYASKTLNQQNFNDKQENEETADKEDAAFDNDDGLVKTSWGTYRPTANVRANSRITRQDNFNSSQTNQVEQPQNIFGRRIESTSSNAKTSDMNTQRLNRASNQNINTISGVNSNYDPISFDEKNESKEFGSRLTRQDRRLRADDYLADASSLGISLKENEQKNETETNDFVSALSRGQEKPKEEPKKAEKVEKISFANQLNRKYNAPPTTLLSLIKEEKEDHSAEYRQKSAILEKTLDTFKIPAKVINVVRGPKVTRYELSMPIGIPVSKVLSYERDMTMALAAKNGIRIEAPIPGKNAFGVEVANDTSTTVGLRELIESPEFKNFKGDLPVAIGKNISGEIIVKSLAKMVHLLVAGSTGSGKSVFLHSLIMSLMYRHSPEELRFIMVDPKRVEFAMYNRMPHLMLPEVVSDTSKAINALNWAVKEMERRYQLLVDNGCQKIDQYNNLPKVKKGEEKRLPYLIIVVDELAELMGVAKKDVEGKIQRITQLGRASGIHMVVATQRPSVDIVTGVIKNNMPTRIAFSLSSAVDSRTILDEIGAEKLLGQGDMLYGGQDSNQKIRLQAAFVPDDEIRATIQYIKDNNISEYDEEVQKEIYAEPEQVEEDDGKVSAGGSSSERQMDELMPQALKLVMKSGKASISMIQRRFQVGYARAARIIDQMETHGFIDGGLGNKPRDIKITIQEYNELFGNFDSDN